MQEAHIAYPDKNEIYRKYEKGETSFELENVHNFFYHIIIIKINLLYLILK